MHGNKHPLTHTPAILALTIDYNSFEPVKQIVFATSGLAAAVVFLFETQNARLVSRL